MTDTDPLAGTTIGPDGNRVPVESEKAVVPEDETAADAITPDPAAVDSGTGEPEAEPEAEAGAPAAEQSGTSESTEQQQAASEGA